MCPVIQKANGCTVPPEGYAMIRYHSCYPWHTGGAYRQLMNQVSSYLIITVRCFCVVLCVLCITCLYITYIVCT